MIYRNKKTKELVFVHGNPVAMDREVSEINKCAELKLVEFMGRGTGIYLLKSFREKFEMVGKWNEKANRLILEDCNCNKLEREIVKKERL